MATEALAYSEAIEPFYKNGYLVACPETREAVYIDPGDEVPLLAPKLDENGLKLAAVLLTHAHLDHISGISDLLAAREAPIYLHAEDLPLYRQLPQQAGWFGLELGPAPPVDHLLEEGQQLVFGSLSFDVHHTPGHAPGHVIFVLGESVYCGDTVFAGSIGRTDLPGGSMTVLLESIRDRILPLGDDKTLHPGHGPATTIGEERRTNPFLASLR